ncbi:hypothetical protein AB4084_35305, partial [Lysobacter sp. 2RAB21]
MNRSAQKPPRDAPALANPRRLCQPTRPPTSRRPVFRHASAMRLNKHISDTGFCSRREADGLIAEG